MSGGKQASWPREGGEGELRLEDFTLATPLKGALPFELRAVSNDKHRLAMVAACLVSLGRSDSLSAGRVEGASNGCSRIPCAESPSKPAVRPCMVRPVCFAESACGSSGDESELQCLASLDPSVPFTMLGYGGETDNEQTTAGRKTGRRSKILNFLTNGVDLLPL